MREHPGLKLYLGSRLIGLEGFAGNFTARIEGPHGEATEEVGSVMVAVDFRPFDSRRKPEYGYGRLKRRTGLFKISVDELMLGLKMLLKGKLKVFPGAKRGGEELKRLFARRESP